MADNTSSFGMTGIPGANFGGGNQAVPGPASNNTPVLGNTNANPFGTTFPSGTSTPDMSSTINGATGSSNLSSLFNVAGTLGFGQGTSQPLKDITKALQKAGFSAGIAGELANFLQSGAGFNPAVAQALIAAMQPQVQRKEADIMEQFSAMGLRGGSPAAIGLGDFLAQEQLNEGEIWAQLYEQSVQNYLNVLLAGKGLPKESGFSKAMDVGNLISSLISSTKGFNMGGGSGSSSGGTDGV